LTEPPPNPSERGGRLPEELDAVVATALAKDPRERQSSAGALLRDCEAALGIRVTIPVVRAPARRSSSPAPAPARATAPAPARATAPAPVAAAAPSAAAEPRSAPRAHATAEGRRSLRRLRMPRLRPLQGAAWVGIALMASGLAGFATGTSGSPQQAAQPRQASTPEAAPAPAAASYADVEQVVDRLNERRAAARRRLRSADTRPEQAAAARNLMTSYAGAYDALRPYTGPRAVLAERVRAVEEAYAGLVAAARSGDPGTWRTARAEALAQERDLELLLRSGRWS
jgi:hypothetical protein